MAYVYSDAYVNDRIIADECGFDRVTVIRAINVFPNYLSQNQKLQLFYNDIVSKIKENIGKYKERTYKIEPDLEKLNAKHRNLEYRYKLLAKKYDRLKNNIRPITYK